MALYLYLAIALIYLIYKWGTKHYNYFKDQGIPYIKPVFLIGSNTNVITKKYALPDLINKWYNDYYDEKVVGLFEGRNPMFLIKDPALTKQIAVKDFEYFLDHRQIISDKTDPLFGKGLFLLQGERWKDMRSTLSPAFTGSKMRLMFDLVTECGRNSTKTLKEQIKKSGNIDFEMRELFSKFTVDMIATCAFGLEVNSFKDPDNDFQKITSLVTAFTKPITALKIMANQIAPKLLEFLNISVMDKKICAFFRETILETMKIREEKGIIRHDMINLLIQARKGQLNHMKLMEDQKEETGFATVEESTMGKTKSARVWDDDDIAAQAFIFFFAGFDTTSTALSFMAHEIAANPDVQAKLMDEINDVQADLDGKTITYDVLQKMKYMDMVVCETLRMWVAAFIDRVCQKDYELKYDNKVVNIKKGTMLWFATVGFMRDPQYFPNPSKFDPERFNEENKHNINMDAFLPFGVGPRNCIGSRFALMEVKAVIFYMLLNFSFEITSKTKIPLVLEKLSFAVRAEGGAWVGLKPRD